MLRKTSLTLFAIALLSMPFFTAASARGGFVARGFHGSVYGGVLGFGLGPGLAGGYYGYPNDDSYDYPYGYGEYAEYGPWAGNNAYRGGCYTVRQRLWTAHGWRRRAVQVCD